MQETVGKKHRTVESLYRTDQQEHRVTKQEHGFIKNYHRPTPQTQTYFSLYVGGQTGIDSKPPAESGGIGELF